MRKKYFISRIDGLHVDDCREVSRSTFYKWRNRALVYSI